MYHKGVIQFKVELIRHDVSIIKQQMKCETVLAGTSDCQKNEKNIGGCGVLKNSFLYMQKAIAAYFVVFIHCTFPVPMGIYVDATARFAVPLFLMISGFYSFGKSDVRRDIYKILKIMCVAYILYFVWFVIRRFPDLELIKSTIVSWFSLESIIGLLVLNRPFTNIGTHLWYLNTVLYCYIIFIFLNKFNLIKFAYVFSLLLLIVHFVLAVGFPYFGIQVPRPMVRNFVLMGMPLFMMGHWIAKNKERIMRIGLSELQFCLIIAVGVILSFVERYFTAKNNLFVGSIIVALFLMIYAMRFPSKFQNTKLEYIGIKYSLFIYICHNIFRDVMTRVYHLFSLRGIAVFDYTLPIVVCLLTTLGAIIFYKISDKIQSTTF